LYLSPSNIFAEFNFDAIAKVCDSNINLVQLTTTADIAYFKSTKNNVGNQTRNAAIFGGIDYGNTKVSTSRGVFGYLPHSLSESIEVERLLKSNNYHVQLYSDKSATKLKFRSLDGTPNEIVHIATHAFCESNIVKDDWELTRTATILSKSGLLFADANEGVKSHSEKGILTAKEIAELDLSGIATIVLSGCSSAMGDLTNTTGLVYGVVNALKSSGVAQIVATLWDLPDELASIAMGRFYSHFVKTADASTALRAMRQDLINLGYSDPYYWANFILIH
jgi:CHAT domain-containing protein